MRYPKGLARRADEILAARRQTAQERHRRMMAALDEQHPEIRAVGRELALLYAQRARLQLDPVQDTGEVEAAIHEAQARRAAAIAAAGLTEADLEPAYTCPLCGDRGVKEGGQMCECRQVILNQLVYEQLCDVSPARECSFANFELRYYGGRDRAAMGKVLESSQRYVREFGGQSQSLLFTGAPGLGKTHLSAAIAREVSGKGYSVVYDTASHVFEQFETQKFSREEDEETSADVERVLQCDLLILDDLGTEMTTAFVQSALYRIVNTRLMEKKSTILNTNLTPGELARRYSPQIASRIEGEYQILPFLGEDIRKLKRRRERP